MQKLVFIAPHLSTGGMPQYLLKKVELLKDEFDIYLIEFAQVSAKYVVQRNKLVALLGEKFFSLPDKQKDQMVDIIKSIQPDIVHLEEHPEWFLYQYEEEPFRWLYRESRKYKILETCHNSVFDVAKKKFMPDKFIFVSQGQAHRYDALQIPKEVVPYPIDPLPRTHTRTEACEQLNIDPQIKHILNVGLFTPDKNQKFLFELAKDTQHLPVQFHFVGNQAVNFKEYWEPLMEDKPDNIKVWGERSDTDVFYQACDLLYFPSKLETNPLVVREALAWQMPVLMYQLSIYGNDYLTNAFVYPIQTSRLYQIQQLKQLLKI